MKIKTTYQNLWGIAKAELSTYKKNTGLINNIMMHLKLL
jgi:hypothetical protein